MKYHAVLDETSFRLLVAGKPATIKLPDGNEVALILSDIGWSRMLRAIEDANR